MESTLLRRKKRAGGDKAVPSSRRRGGNGSGLLNSWFRTDRRLPCRRDSARACKSSEALDRADVITRFEQMSGERMAQRVDGSEQIDASIAFAKIVLMQSAYADEMVGWRFEQILRP